MSIPARNKNCQATLALLDTWYQAVRKHAAALPLSPNNPLKIAVPLDQLAFLAAAWKGENSHPKAIILDLPLEKCQNFLKMITAWETFLNREDAWHLVSNSLSEQEQSGLVVTAHSRALHYLLPAKPSHHVIIPAQILENSDIPNPTAYGQQAITLATGEKLSVSTLAKQLVALGYVRASQAIEPGGFRVRGEQVDIYHPTHTAPITLTFYGSSLETINQTYGTRTTRLPRTTLFPVAFPESSHPLASLLTSRLTFKPEHVPIYSSVGEIMFDSLVPTVQLPFLQNLAPTPAVLDGRICHVLYQNRDRVEQQVTARHPKAVSFCQTDLATWPILLADEGHVVISEATLFPQDQVEPAAPINREQAFELIGALEAGKPAVHADHGVGLYEGLQRRNIDGSEREYLLLRYAAGDSLSVPVEYAHKVTPYISESTPPIYRLGGTLWGKTKKKAQADAAAFAHELLKIATRRSGKTRAPYHIDETLEHELATSFPYTLTPDQAQTWHEVQQDMQGSHPLDRVVVGDVGFGKTEIAIRAARHAVENGQQVALLAPTTLLVQQHYDTFVQRLPDMADHIGLLSRFATAKQQHAVRQRIEDGSCTIAIGTHALFNKHTHWKNLGLAIIDEEQQFGVKHKEHFKRLRSEIDMLSLSATPIPRTLSMALSGLRRLSIIATPPSGRKDIITKVAKRSERILQEALGRELTRSGQAYVVAPKVRQLAAIQVELGALFPQAKIAVAHGQMPERNLEKVMHRFDAGEVDILLASSIIENGLDLPNANTLVVFSSTHFGLADLYQLRGRIGRRDRQGYAYFLYSQEEMTIPQRRRLTALTEASHLGAGWLIARRDLEIRGAGNILGAQQSGSVNAVGVQLYLDMVNQAMEGNEARRDVEIELPLPAILPTHYIADTDERSRWYQRLSRATNAARLAKRIEELKRKYGPLPLEASTFILILKLQHAAAEGGITKITSRKITPPDEDPYWRLEVFANYVPALLAKLQPLGNWSAKNDSLTLNVDAISPAFVKTLLAAINQNEIH